MRMNDAPVTGQLSSPGWSVRSMAKPGVFSQSALAAAAWNEAIVGRTKFPSWFFRLAQGMAFWRA
jgi:hypothetical protein